MNDLLLFLKERNKLKGDKMKFMKSDLFLVQLKRVIQTLNRNEVKSVLGDSTINHRTLTVNQVIRFLSRRKDTFDLGANLQIAFNRLRPLIIQGRSVTRNRTDAIDINEFVTYYTTFVVALSNKTARTNFSKQLVNLEVNI